MKKINVNLENEYIQASPWANDTRMVEFLKKDNIAYYKTKEGYLMEFKKPQIEKNFCFEYGYNGVDTFDELGMAESCADYVRAKEEYFINENLRNINKIIESFKLAIEFGNDDITIKRQAKENIEWAGCYSPWDFKKIVFTWNYMNNQKIIKYTKWDYSDSYEYEESLKKNSFSRIKGLYIRDCTTEELKDILTIYEAIKEYLIKRLDTYLKKYGTTKLNVWTYLRD